MNKRVISLLFAVGIVAPAHAQVTKVWDGTRTATVSAPNAGLPASASGLGVTLSPNSANPTGAATATNQTSGNASLTSIDGKTPALVGGRVPVDGSGVTQPVSGPLTDTQLRASPVPVSAAISGGTSTANQGTPNSAANAWPFYPTVGGVAIDPRVRTWVLSSATDSVDVNDRAGRLLGITYGSQGQQLQQSATNFNLFAELRTGGTAYDARQIRPLTAVDVVTAQAASSTIIDDTGTPLAGNATFTGACFDTRLGADITLGISADQASATNGLTVRWSRVSDCSVIADTDQYSIPAGNGQQYSFGPKFTYAQFAYQNGATPQTVFAFTTIRRTTHVRGSTHRGGDSVDLREQDTELVTSIPKGIDPNGISRQLAVDTSANLKVTTNPGTTATTTAVALTTTGSSVVATNTARKALKIYDRSSSPIVWCVYFNATNVTSEATASFAITPGQTFEMPWQPNGVEYTGQINCAASTGTANVQVTEVQ